MAHCPNCGRKLHLTDWRPECPGCHVNLNYFNSNERLLEDSEKAEIEHAKFQPKVDRAKAAYAGSKMAIIRIVLSVLPIGALFLPLCSAKDGTLNILDVYKMLSADPNALLSGLFKGDFSSLFVLSLALSVVMILVGLIAIIASLGKHGKVRSFVLYGLHLLLAVLSLIFAALSGGAKIGLYLYAALVAVLFIWNVILFKTGIPVRYTPCLIGGLPSEEYFSMVEQGMTQAQIRRKMLVALAELQEAEDAKREAEEKEAAICPQ